MTDVPLYKIKLLFCLAISALFMVSCSESDPELNNATGFVIFDYSSEKSIPTVRLAAFAETVSEIQRVDSISVKNIHTGYEWISDKPVLLSNEKHKWAGYADFVSPAGHDIPTGLYEMVYTDAQSKTVQKNFSVYYKNAFLTANSEKAKTLFSDEKSVVVCVYSERGTLLYYGQRKENWVEDKTIFDSVKDSFYLRECYVEGDKSVYCLMPPVYKKSVKKSSENQK